MKKKKNWTNFIPVTVFGLIAILMTCRSQSYKQKEQRLASVYPDLQNYVHLLEKSQNTFQFYDELNSVPPEHIGKILPIVFLPPTIAEQWLRDGDPPAFEKPEYDAIPIHHGTVDQRILAKLEKRSFLDQPFLAKLEERSFSPKSDQIRAIAGLQWGQATRGRYQSGASQVEYYCNITLIDVATETVDLRTTLWDAHEHKEIFASNSVGGCRHLERKIVSLLTTANAEKQIEESGASGEPQRDIQLRISTSSAKETESEADRLIQKAGSEWDLGLHRQSIETSNEALRTLQNSLEPDDERIIELKKRIEYAVRVLNDSEMPQQEVEKP